MTKQERKHKSFHITMPFYLVPNLEWNGDGETLTRHAASYDTKILLRRFSTAQE